MQGEASRKAIATRALVGLLLLFAVLVGLRVHGFSIPQWHSVLGDPSTPEVLLGQPRYLRADDWLVQLPLAFAQRAHDPPFPVENTNIGHGQNMLLPIESPVAHPVALFRPTLWGFFLGKDLGMSWLWWSQILGLAGVFFVVFSIVTRGQTALSAMGAAFLLVAPFFQFWAFTKSTIPLFMGLSFIATTRILSEKSPAAIVLYGLLLSWSGVAYAVVLYPPFQVPLFYLYLLLVGLWCWEKRLDAPWRPQIRMRLGAGIAAAMIAVVTLGLLTLDAREPIDLALGTAYPGQRVSTGGATPPWRLLTAHFASGRVAADFRQLGNIVEASSFVVLFPLIGLVVALRRMRDPWLLGLLAYCLLALAYQVFGFPDWLARATLLSFVPGDRLILGLGIADALLLLRFMAVVGEAPSAPPKLSLGIALAWGGLLFLGGRALMEHLPEMSTGILIAGLVAQVALGYALARGLRPLVLLGLLCIATAATTLHFNPLVRGGSRYLVDNALAQAILEIDEAESGESSWLVYESSDLPNLLRALGVQSFGGAVTLPQLSMWRILDPDAKATDVYNRYAHVGFRPPKEVGQPAHFRLSSHHGFLVYLDPEGEDPEQLGATHLLVRNRSRSWWYWRRFEPLEIIGQHLLFELPLRRRGVAD